MGSDETRCIGPDRCWDDLCCGNDFGICGEPSAHVLGLDCGDLDCDRCHDALVGFDDGYCPGCTDPRCPDCGEGPPAPGDERYACPTPSSPPPEGDGA